MNKLILITGAGGGMGNSIVRHLATHGHIIIATDLSLNHMESINELRNVYCYEMDVADEKSIISVLNLVQSKFGFLDVLINNAAVMEIEPVSEMPVNRFYYIMAVNFLGAQAVTKHFFGLLAKKNGRIINISSESAKTTIAFFPYTISKKALEAWHHVLAMECKLIGMKAILIRPGAHKTDLLIKRADPENSVYFKKQLKNLNKQYDKEAKNPADPLDVAKIVYKAIESHNPKRVYHVNNSFFVNFIRILPKSIYEKLVVRILNAN